MTAITDLSDLVNLLTGGGSPEHIFRTFDNRIGAAAATTCVVNRWTSLWRYNNTQNPTSTLPGAAAIPTNTTAGALKQTDPAAGKQKWLLGVEGAVTFTMGTLMIYDRLMHRGGLDGTVTTEQTVQGDPASPALTRYATAADCVGNEIWIEIGSTIGASNTTLTVNYFNQDGVLTAAPVISIGGSNLREGERMLPVPLASGDTGVRGVKSVQLTATTGTAGDFAVVIMRPLLMIPVQNTIPFLRDCISGFPSVPEILTDACLAMAWLPLATTPPQGIVGFHFVEK